MIAVLQHELQILMHQTGAAMRYANKIMEVVALVTFLLVLAEVISSDAYSLAAQAQASGDSALMHLSFDEHGDNAAAQFASVGEQKTVTQ